MSLFETHIIKSANFSPDRLYRYTLWRQWVPGPMLDIRYVNFICLNPSTADEKADDRTVLKCIKFARAWGFEGLCITNLFAIRTKDPAIMKVKTFPIGPENDKVLKKVASQAGLVVAAWSQHGSYLNRANEVKELLKELPLHVLKITTGEPHHPLYLKDNTEPIPWEII